METSKEKAKVLVEALPYIQSFRGKTVVIKYGGSAISATGDVDNVLRDVVFMEAVGMRPVIVHGGGKRITERMREAGVQPRFVDGLRVTDDRAMEIVEDALFGEVNPQIVGAIRRFNGRAEGLSGREAGILRVEKLTPLVGGQRVDVGRVGSVTSVDTLPILQLCDQDVIPVIAPIGLGKDGGSYNVNADTAAAKIAAALRAEKLVFLTDVVGILRDRSDEASLYSTLSVDAVDELIRRGVIDGGMIPKIEACVDAVKAGVHKTHIIDGRITHSLLLEVYTDRGIGTQITL
jgi:acetylglutamate kinase